jgi:phage repressor protein C with HTH and peptisase S24 domain
LDRPRPAGRPFEAFAVRARKRSGLDPTTFNKSKRITPDGRARWPSTESIAKALSATSVSVESFVSLIGESNGARRRCR